MEKHLNSGPKMHSGHVDSVHTTIVITHEDLCKIFEDFDGTTAELNEWRLKEKRYSVLKGTVIAKAEGDVQKAIRFSFDLQKANPYIRLIGHNSETLCEYQILEDLFNDLDNTEWELVRFDKDRFMQFSYPTMCANHHEHNERIKDIRNKLSLCHDLQKKLRAGKIKGHTKETTVEALSRGDVAIKELNSYLKKSGGIEERYNSFAEEMLDEACFECYLLLLYVMKRFVDRPMQEVAGDTREKLVREHGITATYKYNGKVNLVDNRVYKSTGTPSEKKEFIRHIGRWLVRGHWRKYEDGKTIWIEQYEKGEGRMEKRTYVTGQDF